MDEMKIKSKFMRGVIAKLVGRMVKRKVGYEVDIQLNEFAVTITDGVGHVHVNVDAELNKDELMRLLGEIGL